MAGAISWGTNAANGSYIGVANNTNMIGDGSDVLIPSIDTNTGNGNGQTSDQHGIQVNSSTWAFLVGTATVTIKASDLSGSGTLQYLAELTTHPVNPTASWWQTDTGTANQTINGPSTLNPDGTPTTGTPLTISYTALVSNATLALSNLTTAGTIFVGGSLSASGTLTASVSAATNAKLSLAGVAGVTVAGGTATSASLGGRHAAVAECDGQRDDGGQLCVDLHRDQRQRQRDRGDGDVEPDGSGARQPDGDGDGEHRQRAGRHQNVTATMTLGNAASDVNMTRGDLQVTGTTAGLTGAPSGRCSGPARRRR